MNRGKSAIRRVKIYVLCFLLVLGLYGYWTLGRALPPLIHFKAPAVLDLQTPPAYIQWPAQGQSAVSVVGSDITASHGVQTPVPTASTAKIITSLVVLDKKPLAASAQGPTITLGPNDVALYGQYLAQDGSVVPVTAGEQISEYQALQAVMLPSANNLADSLAIWAFGSLPAYSAAAEQYLAAHGIKHTHVGSDASGLSPSTTSTAEDLAKLGVLAMQNPVLSSIVAQTSATGVPPAGELKNVNFLLGTNGVVGVKTGNSDQAGGVFVSASKTTLAGKAQTVVTSYAAAPNLFTAVKGSLPMIASAQANFKANELLPGGSIVGYYKQLNGESLPVVTSQPITVIAWQGAKVSAKLKFASINPATRARTVVGSVEISSTNLNSPQTVSLVLQKSARPPSTWWRLTHPF